MFKFFTKKKMVNNESFGFDPKKSIPWRKFIDPDLDQERTAFMDTNVIPQIKLICQHAESSKWSSSFPYTDQLWETRFVGRQEQMENLLPQILGMITDVIKAARGEPVLGSGPDSALAVVKLCASILKQLDEEGEPSKLGSMIYFKKEMLMMMVRSTEFRTFILDLHAKNTRLFISPAELELLKKGSYHGLGHICDLNRLSFDLRLLAAELLIAQTDDISLFVNPPEPEIIEELVLTNEAEVLSISKERMAAILSGSENTLLNYQADEWFNYARIAVFYMGKRYGFVDWDANILEVVDMLTNKSKRIEFINRSIAHIKGCSHKDIDDSKTFFAIRKMIDMERSDHETRSAIFGTLINQWTKKPFEEVVSVH